MKAERLLRFLRWLCCGAREVAKLCSSRADMLKILAAKEFLQTGLLLWKTARNCRAFTKISAIANEDASGDVMALQRQIQMLKEQISILIKHQNTSKPPFQGAEEIKRLELLANDIISTNNYLTDENNALKEEIKQLQAKIDRNPEVTRFQGCYELGERETLLAEVVALHNQRTASQCSEISSTERAMVGGLGDSCVSSRT
ncbi:kinesin, motor domain-containing protein [Tanacetum coccineum]